jgi:hypothetical protein
MEVLLFRMLEKNVHTEGINAYLQTIKNALILEDQSG